MNKYNDILDNSKRYSDRIVRTVPEMELEGLEEEREEVRMPKLKNEMLVESI